MLRLRVGLLLLTLLSIIGNAAFAAGNGPGAPWSSLTGSKEILELRTQNSKHFRTADGKMTAFYGSGSIHYQLGSQWLEISNDIATEDGRNGFAFSNTSNSFKTFYPANPFVGFVKTEYNGLVYQERVKAIKILNMAGQVIGTLPISNQIVGKVQGSNLVYQNIVKGIDLVYTQMNDGRKLNVVIKNAAALAFFSAKGSSVVIEEEVILPNGTTLVQNGQQFSINRGASVEATFSKPVAFDGHNTGAVEAEMQTEGTMTSNRLGKSSYTVNSSFPLSWINSSTRNFPISLDPSINYGPFAVSMATGYMTSATGAKTNGFLRLASTNTFAWAKFNVAAFSTVGATSIDSVRYWGYHYTTLTTPDKIAKVVDMDSIDPVSALNTVIVSKINAKTNISPAYSFSSNPFNWRAGTLDTSFNSLLPAYVTRGWAAVGFAYLSGTTTFAYQYGWNATGAGATLINYMQVYYTLPPCSSPVTAGTVNGPSLACGGSTINLSLSGSSVGAGMTYQWQSSPDSVTWTNITSANFETYSTIFTVDSMFYRCELICSAGTPAYTPGRKIMADIHVVTVANPYNEGFESITVNNQLPACMAATNLSTITYTYTAAQGSWNRAARTGSKFASYRYACNDFFFTKGLKLDSGVTYSMSTWFVTDGITGSWDSVALYIATAPNASSVTLLPGTTRIQPSNITYEQLLGSFTPTTSGVYRLAIKVKDPGIPWYLSIDDIKVEVAVVPTVSTGTKNSITTSGANLSGTIIANGGSLITATGFVVSTSPSPVRGGTGVIDSTITPTATSGSFNKTIGGLALSTTYYYRAYAVNSVGVAYGPDSTFTTAAAASLPTVNRLAATLIGTTTARVGGNIMSDGGAAITTNGVVIGTSPNPAIAGTGVIDSVSTPTVTLGAYNFNLAGLSHSTKYYYRAYAINTVGTAYSTQDSFTTSPIVSYLPYAQNFDTAGLNTGWSNTAIGAGANDWVLGTPAKTQLNSAFSGPNSWVTKTSGAYSNSANAAVVSPQFDFSAITVNPLIRFRHNFNAEGGWDGGILEMDTTGTGIWIKIDNATGTGATFNTANSTGWYNGTANAHGGPAWQGASTGYTGNTSGWVQSQTTLPGVAGKSNVKVRFRFASDVSVNTPDGWAIDNIEVFLPSAPTVATGTKTSITTSSVTLAGNILSNGGANVTTSGIVVGTSANPVIGGTGVIDSVTTPTVGAGVFTRNIAGLTSATTYYYRAYAINSIGTTYGPDSTFTTNASAVVATVNRIAATSVGGFTATLGGNITSDGGSAVTVSGVVVATTRNPALGGTGVIGSVTTPNVALGSFSFNVAGLSHSTKYFYRAYAINAVGTAYSTMDSFNTAPVINYLPYAQNFDTAFLNTGWSSAAIGAGANDWVVGTPAKTQIAGAFSSPNSWVTKTTGAYSNSGNAAVVSPQFDFTSAAVNPIIRFRHNFNAEGGWDGGILEMDTTGTGIWVKVDNTTGTGATFNTANSTGWYNGNANAHGGTAWQNASTAYTGHSSGWIQSQTTLPGAAGKSNVKVRFRFASDASVNTPDGWAIDNIEIFLPSAPTIATGTKTNITTSTVTLAGNISSNGGATVTTSGIVVGTSANPVIGGTGVIDSITTPTVGAGAFTKDIAGLATATTYYYRAYAINSIGTSYGADSTFTTNSAAVIPTVVRTPATLVTTTTAVIGGNITSNGGSTVTASGVVYATTPNPAISGTGVVDSTTSPVVATGTFSIAPAGLSHSTKYYFRAYAINSVGTAYSAQDSFTTAPIVSTFPYSQNFDGAATSGWSAVATGGLNEWVLGTPSKTQLSSAYSSPNSWVTKTTGIYSNGHDAAIVSPQFNFSSFTNDPIISFYHNFKTEAGWDGTILELSTNGGTTWTKVNDATGAGATFNTPLSAGWYNGTITGTAFAGITWHNTSTAYAGNTGGWIMSQTRLQGAAGQPNVRVRFRFASDAFVQDEGVALDNISVIEVNTPTTQASGVTVSNIANDSCTLTWTNGNGTRRIVVGRLTSGTTVAPTDSQFYAANRIFGTGGTTGTGNFVLYDGTGNTVNVKGLATATGYTFAVYEFNGTLMHTKYLRPGATSTMTTLPVEMTYFKGINVDGDAKLVWGTASELNNKGFEVERSVNGKSFETIGFVKGNGTTSNMHNYSIVDRLPFQTLGVQTVYYRLKQVDFDGKYAYSAIVTLNSADASVEDVKTYPNPFANELGIYTQVNNDSRVDIKIIDIQGREIAKESVDAKAGSQYIGLRSSISLVPGIYFVQVQMNGMTKSFKVQKVN